MNDDELKELWLSQPPGGPQLSGSELILSVKTKMRKMDRTLFWRDAREYAACLFIVWWFGIREAFAHNPTALAGRIVLVASCFLIAGVLYYSQRRARAKPGIASVREELDAELRKIDWQIKLLSSVLWWYALPISIGCALIVCGTTTAAGARVAGLAVVVLVCVFVCWLNRVAVKRTLVPLREQLLQAINSMTAL